MSNITSADAAVFLTVTGLYDTPQQLQAFSPDQMFDLPDIENKELQIGADGVLAAGYIFNRLDLEFAFLASSASCVLFEVWSATENTGKLALPANLSIVLNATGTAYDYVGGFLMKTNPMPSAHRVLQTRKWGISFINSQLSISPTA